MIFLVVSKTHSRWRDLMSPGSQNKVLITCTQVLFVTAFTHCSILENTQGVDNRCHNCDLVRYEYCGHTQLTDPGSSPAGLGSVPAVEESAAPVWPGVSRPLEAAVLRPCVHHLRVSAPSLLSAAASAAAHSTEHHRAEPSASRAR